MGHQITKQPNGKYAVFSTIVDDFIWMDLETLDPYIEDVLKEEERRLRESIQRRVEMLDAGEKAYGPYTSSWDDLLELIRLNHGEDAETLQWVQENIKGKSDG